jgi:phosphoserine phosphatase RsbU/P
LAYPDDPDENRFASARQEHGMSNILVVDDIAKNIQLLGSILEREKYAVSFAMHGVQALEIIAEQDFDLILLDVMMPGMDGFQVCEQIKQMPGKADIPIIFLTAKSERMEIVQGFSVGAADYITKPFNTAELLARVETHLKLKQARDALVEKNRELQQALETIKTLEGIIPICSFCKKIRDDEGYWNLVEAYIAKHSNAEFSHGICPDCLAKYYPGFEDE